MMTSDRRWDRRTVSRYTGDLSQIGGTRHYELSEGKARSVRAMDVATGMGLQFTVLSDRGMDISRCSYRGTNLVYRTAMGEVHPAYYDPRGQEWLRGFFGGLMTTCGLTYLGPPCQDQGQELGLHGRHSYTPAKRFNDLSRWVNDQSYVIELRGEIEDAALFSEKVRLLRTIRTELDSRCLAIIDKVENFGRTAAPLTVLYHVNVGFPLLDENAELLVGAVSYVPCDDAARAHLDHRFGFVEPLTTCEEQNFHYEMIGDKNGLAHAAIINRNLENGLGLHLAFSVKTLPFLNEWKMMAEGDYVVGIEPCNVPCLDRATLRKTGALPFLESGESKSLRIDVEIIEGAKEIEQLRSFMCNLQQQAGGKTSDSNKQAK